MKVRQTGFALIAVAGLAACQPTVPDSGAAAGFDNYNSYSAARDAQLQGGAAIPTAPTISQETLSSTGAPVASVAGATAAPGRTAALEERALEAINTASEAEANSGVVPVQASPANPAPTVSVAAAANPGISSENDFSAVSSERSISADAALIARNRDLYTVIAPEALPTRQGSGPNIVSFALATNNAVGQPLYNRSGFRAETRYDKACAGYASSDLAQADFLAKGGPQKDRLGVDPDGDGFACTWDPAPFRLAVRN